MRLIDADALLDKTWDADTRAGYVNVVDAGDILEAPTVDAVPTRHGHWASLTDCSNAGVYCSVCNKKVYKEDYAPCNKKNKLRSNYCPNCGAKMDEKEEDY